MAESNKSPRDKRFRERNLKDKQQEKELRRLERKEIKKTRAEGLGLGEDPDLIGIIPGPQPPQED